MIRVTDVKIFPFDVGEPSSKVRAYAEVTLEDCLSIRGFKIVETESGGLFVGFPSRKGKDNEYHDWVIPTTPEYKKYLRDRIIEAYKNFS